MPHVLSSRQWALPRLEQASRRFPAGCGGVGHWARWCSQRSACYAIASTSPRPWTWASTCKVSGRSPTASGTRPSKNCTCSGITCHPSRSPSRCSPTSRSPPSSGSSFGERGDRQRSMPAFRLGRAMAGRNGAVLGVLVRARTDAVVWVVVRRSSRHARHRAAHVARGPCGAEPHAAGARGWPKLSSWRSERMWRFSARWSSASRSLRTRQKALPRSPSALWR